jgi:hypothetical protein
MQPRERFPLTIQDAEQRNLVPLTSRLRRLLKAMLRGYGIRCVDMRPVGSVTKTDQQKNTVETVVEQYSTDEYPSADETQTNIPDRPTATLHRSG